MARRDKRVYKYLNFALSFGLTMGITIYLLYLGGKWLDNRLGTTPLFICLGVLLAIVTVLKQLITDAVKLEGPEGKISTEQEKRQRDT